LASIAKHLAPAHFKSATIVREVADFYSSRSRNLGVSLIVNTQTEREVLGSAGELRQILSNLLANSLDACVSGSTIADTGFGIPARHLASIFEPFFTTKKDTGTDLGLWVSRELVAKHGGSLRVRSRTSAPFSGTVFSIFLPNRGGLHAIDALSASDHAATSPGVL
jgi:signal transduction histidine kinase